MTKLISLKEVSDLVGLKKSAIYERVSFGEFPKPVKLSQRCSRWSLVEVQKWIRQELDARHEG